MSLSSSPKGSTGAWLGDLAIISFRSLTRRRARSNGLMNNMRRHKTEYTEVCVCISLGFYKVQQVHFKYNVRELNGFWSHGIVVRCRFHATAIHTIIWATCWFISIWGFIFPRHGIIEYISRRLCRRALRLPFAVGWRWRCFHVLFWFCECFGLLFVVFCFKVCLVFCFFSLDFCYSTLERLCKATAWRRVNAELRDLAVEYHVYVALCLSVCLCVLNII